MIAPPRGIKKQVLGGVLFGLGAINALLARIVGFELDNFYVVMSIIGAGLFLYGVLQKNRHETTTSGTKNIDPAATTGCCWRR